MSRISGRSLEAVKERADIVELARARTELRQVRDEWIGRCPFHEERSPSFSVNAGKKLYYCFGCGAKGDVIDFVRQTEADQAVDVLAERSVARPAAPGELGRYVRIELDRGPHASKHISTYASVRRTRRGGAFPCSTPRFAKLTA